MIEDWLKVEYHKGGVLQVELNNPPVNSLSATKLRELRKFFNAVASDNRVSSVLLTSGQKVFSAGLNLKEAQTYDIEAQSDVVNAFHECFLELYSFPKPLICAVEGAAIAGGLFPVLCSDYRIAEEKAQFGLAEVRVGVGFPVGLVEIVRAEVTQNVMRAMMLSGQPISARAAEKAGIVDELVPEGDASDRAMQVVVEYSQLPPQAYKTVKQQIRAPIIAALNSEVTKAETSAPKAWYTDETEQAMSKMIR
jgi:enoyl-CoA hydratase